MIYIYIYPLCTTPGRQIGYNLTNPEQEIVGLFFGDFLKKYLLRQAMDPDHDSSIL